MTEQHERERPTTEPTQAPTEAPTEARPEAGTETGTETGPGPARAEEPAVEPARATSPGRSGGTATAERTERTEPARKKGRGAGAMVKAGTDAVRSRIASLVWLVAVVCALFLAVGALLIALKMNQDNAIVAFVLDGAKALDLGVFKDFSGKDAQVKEALTNWGIAAVIYLVVGKVADRVIRP